MPNTEEKPQEKKPKSGYWYMTYTDECVLCGRGETVKYRVYDRPKPEDIADRYEYSQYACGSHFL